MVTPVEVVVVVADPGTRDRSCHEGSVDADPGALARSCRRGSVDAAPGVMVLLKLTMSGALLLLASLPSMSFLVSSHDGAPGKFLW